VTGLDLVALQLQVAQGEPLGLSQDDIQLRGHAIEARLYTEDPAQDFLPTSGPVDLWVAPTGAGIRVDDGIVTGQVISPFYDPMVAKIIAGGPTRDIARLRLIEALQATVLFGPRHNRDFLVACLRKECFAQGEATTSFIAEQFAPGEISGTAPDFTDSAVAAVIELRLEHDAAHGSSVMVAPQLRDWSSASALVSRKRYQHGEFTHDLAVSPLGNANYRVCDASESRLIELLSLDGGTAHVAIDGNRHTVRYHHPGAGKLYMSMDERAGEFRDLIRLDGALARSAGGGRIIAPMHGLLLEVRVAPGASVKAGETLAVLEAMKMHYEIVAEAAGTVREVLAEAGAQVAADDVLVEIDPAGDA
ncbi:MAG: 3-methylcrotonyl-CoA carboxylase, partial [Halioglobus sp.]|nr:3-methylcrotonyl-CoA carboxylase [Halioglobus sp.]